MLFKISWCCIRRTTLGFLLLFCCWKDNSFCDDIMLRQMPKFLSLLHSISHLMTYLYIFYTLSLAPHFPWNMLPKKKWTKLYEDAPNLFIFPFKGSFPLRKNNCLFCCNVQHIPSALQTPHLAQEFSCTKFNFNLCTNVKMLTQSVSGKML